MALVGGAALAAVAVGAVAYAAMQKPAATPSQTPGAGPALPAGLTPVTTLTQGQNYTFAAVTPANLNDTTALATALAGAGWGAPQIVSFTGPGLPYVASGQWTGATGPVPVGMVAGT